VIHGARDRLLPASGAEQLAARLRGAKLEILQGVGHCPHIEQPEAVLSAIRAALG